MPEVLATYDMTQRSLLEQQRPPANGRWNRHTPHCLMSHR